MRQPYKFTLEVVVHADDLEAAVDFAEYASDLVFDADYGHVSLRVARVSRSEPVFDDEEYERWCCLECGCHAVGDATIEDHGRCYACHKAWQARQRGEGAGG